MPNIKKMELYSLNVERDLEKWEKEELFKNYEDISYLEKEKEVAFFENEEEYLKKNGMWNGPYVILSKLETVGDFKTIKTIKENSYYVENQLHNISRIKFSEDFEEVIEIYKKNGEMDELWFETEEEKKNAFEIIKKELMDFGITIDEIKNISNKTKINLSLLGNRFSLINQLIK